mmetsp:Transcript_85887/g.188631  ORF Transcript_85887/g.188631 Transcript_85887/m.188631 type:complete len:89 (-) Transcript_85887:722-988(-)
MFGLVVGRMREGGTSSDVRGCWTGAADRYEERKRELRISAGMLAQGRSSSALAVKEEIGLCAQRSVREVLSPTLALLKPELYEVRQLT